jgi:outer membrane protein assembly factor BamB
LVGAAVASAGQVYAVNLRDTPNTLLSFPVSMPAENIVANVAIDTFAMDFNSLGTTLYAIEYVSPNPVSFGTINTTTGAYNVIAPLTGVGAGENATGLSVDPLTETFYLSTVIGAGTNKLYTVNPTTGVATFVAPMSGATELFIDIAIGPTGQMYAHDIANDTLYSVDKATGVTTAIGLTGFAANFAQGMDFDYADGNLYATVYTGAGTGKFVQFDLNTGAGIVLADTTPWNAEMEMAIDTPVPEPTTLALLGVALLLRRR